MPDPAECLLVFAPGTPVRVGGSIPGYVTAVTLRGPRDRPYVVYEVCWFVDGCRHQEWFADHEVVQDGAVVGPVLPIGFISGTATNWPTFGP